MPAYFKLINKVTGNTATLDDVDKEICTLLGKSYNEHKWCYLGPKRISGLDWYNLIGMSLSTGHSYEETKKLMDDDEEVNKICDYLEATYDVDCGYNPRR